MWNVPFHVLEREWWIKCSPSPCPCEACVLRALTLQRESVDSETSGAFPKVTQPVSGKVQMHPNFGSNVCTPSSSPSCLDEIGLGRGSLNYLGKQRQRDMSSLQNKSTCFPLGSSRVSAQAPSQFAILEQTEGNSQTSALFEPPAPQVSSGVQFLVESQEMSWTVTVRNKCLEEIRRLAQILAYNLPARLFVILLKFNK